MQPHDSGPTGLAVATAPGLAHGVSGAPMSGADLVSVSGVCGSGVVVVRDARTAVGAVMAGWESRRFVVDPQPVGWWGDPWSFELVDGWRELRGRPLAEVCARQWLTLQITALREAADCVVVSFEELVSDPRATESRLSSELGVDVQVLVGEPADPFVRPRDLGEVLAGLSANQGLWDEYLDLVDALGVTGYRDRLPEVTVPVVDKRRDSAGTSWHSSFTSTVPELLASAGASLVITTYKAGQVIIARTDDGASLDTHFTSMQRPMGTAVGGRRVAVGAADSVVVYASHDVGGQVPVTPTPDLVLVPKAVCFTGDVAIHDMAWDVDGQLWFVNTRFSCLSTLDMYSSFTCEWKPSWISSLAAEDRCHLNGLAMMNGHPRFVTALAQTDDPNGWRDHKGTGGVIVDITTDTVIADGLSMPHSPRWHNDALWFLQSGTGALNRINPATGAIDQITQLPGFTRGLAFIGHYALVGLSQVRESVFTDLPITQTAAERNCGVWVVDTRTGATTGFIKFTGSVTEIFDVNIIHTRWPHIGEPGDLTKTSFSLTTETLTHLHNTTDTNTEGATE